MFQVGILIVNLNHYNATYLGSYFCKYDWHYFRYNTCHTLLINESQTIPVTFRVSHLCHTCDMYHRFISEVFTVGIMYSNVGVDNYVQYGELLFHLFG